MKRPNEDIDSLVVFVQKTVQKQAERIIFWTIFDQLCPTEGGGWVSEAQLKYEEVKQLQTQRKNT